MDKNKKLKSEVLERLTFLQLKHPAVLTDDDKLEIIKLKKVLAELSSK